MRSGRPPRYPADEMKVISYRVRPRFAEAVKAQAKSRNVSQGELLDRLAERAGFYPDVEATSPAVECKHWRITTVEGVRRCQQCQMEMP